MMGPLSAIVMATATSAPVTNWPVRIVLVALVVAVIAAVLWAMRQGWRNRERRQADLPEPAPIPAAGEAEVIGESGAVDSAVVPGVYLGSVIAGDWLDRIAAHGLGTRSRVDLQVRADGIAVHRPGARSFFIPGADLVAVRRDRGIAGKAFEKDAVVVITWQLGATAVDTGIRPDAGDDADRLSDLITDRFTDRFRDRSTPDSDGSEPTQR